MRTFTCRSTFLYAEIYHLLGMKSFRDDLIDRMKTGWGRVVLASTVIRGGQRKFLLQTARR